MGIVFKARQVGLNRTVALKVLRRGAFASAEELARFATEARALACLEHPNIVRVYDAGEHGGCPYLALELVEGGSLEDRIAETPFPARQAAQVVEALARAAHHAHGQAIVHRDLKPANVLLTADNVPKITDFGLAKRLDGVEGRTASGAILGTPAYLAPEQAAGRSKEVGPATDVYGLGAILYALLTGRPPFQGTGVADTLRQVRSGEPMPPRHRQPGVPRALEAVCMRCLDKNPRQRYPSAAALADDLGRFLRGEPVAARPADRRARRLAWAALVLAGTLAAAFLILLLVRMRRPASVGEKPEANNRAVLEDAGPNHLAVLEHAGSAAGTPILRLNPGGPTAGVNALVFSRDGDTLYAVGSDKIVRVWHDKDERFELDSVTYRVPVGPGLHGTVNALALSPDGKWLAAGGLMIVRDQADFRQGRLMPNDGLTDEQRQDTGAIYLFDTRTQAVRLLRGHRGPVLALAFAPAREGQPLVLVSAAQEWDAEARHHVGKLRAWDVGGGKQLDELQARGDDPRGTRPGLAVDRPRDQPEQVLVALAWGAGQLRFWQPGRDQSQVARDGKDNNLTAAFVPGTGSLLTTTFDIGAGLHEWRLPPQGVPTRGDRLLFPAGANNVADTILALTLCSSRPGRPADLAALLVRVHGQQAIEYHIRLIGLDRPFRVLRDINLKWDAAGLSVLAAVPGGAYLALAGNRDNQPISVFRIDSLLGNPQPPVTLRSAGTKVRHAAFVKRGKRVGLLLNEAEAAARDPWLGALVFDLTGRDFSPKAEGWELDLPAMDGLSTDQPRWAGAGDAQRWSIAVRQNNAVKQQVELKPGWEVQRYALLPPLAPLQVSILAVAVSDTGGQTRLYLYNAATGEQVRELSGHTARIHSLVFSGDGRLLVSAGDDQTMCVWSLTNLDRSVGKAGGLPGVALRRNPAGAQAAPEIVQVNGAGAAQGQLRVGDTLEGVTVEGGRPLHPLTTLELYEALWVVKPGTNVTLTVRGDQGQQRQVVLRVGQGVDEPKPLFSLFITREVNGRPREWIGWSPYGPYDSGVAQTERLLGWHFNPTDPASPTSAFATADQYRKEYRRQGILKNLVAEADLKRALGAWEKEQPPPLPPRMGLWIKELGPDPRVIDNRGQVLVRGPTVTLAVAVHDFPIDRVDSLTWQLDDGPPVAFGPGRGREREADLAAVLQRRGLHKVRVVLRNSEVEPGEKVQELLLRYQPERPEVAIEAPDDPVVRQAAFHLRATVKPDKNAQVGVKVIVVQRHRAQGKEEEVLRKDFDGSVDQELTLRPGDNDIEVLAENAGALAGYQDAERTRQRLRLQYVPEQGKASAPQVDVKVFQPAGPRGVRGGTVVVHTPKVRLVGTLMAQKENLTSAALARDDGPLRPLTNFKPGTARQYVVDEEVDLDPTKAVTFRVTAQTANSAAEQAELSVDYRPLPPTVDLVAPAPLYEGQERQATITGRLKPPADGNTAAYEARVLVNDKPTDAVPRIDAARETLEAAVPLPQQRDTPVRVELRTKRGAATVSDPVDILYLRPPHDLKLEAPQVGKSAVVEVVGWAESALPLTKVEAHVKGAKEATERDVTGATFEAAGAGAWTIRLPKVALEEGKNTVTLWASNADGRSLKPATLGVIYQPPQLPAPPEVEFSDPRENVSVTAAARTVRFHVTSAGPLRSVELVRETRPPLIIPVALAGVQANAQWRYEFEREVPLLRGLNPLSARATNDGGERRAGVVVTRVEEPVRVVIDSVKSVGAGGQTLKPERLPDGRLSLRGELGSGVVQLSGHVVWDPANPPPGHPGGVPQVQVYVNNSKQDPVTLDLRAGDGAGKAFRATLVLNRQGANEVLVEVPGLKQEALTRRAFAVTCSRPVPDQRWHLLVVGVGKQKPEELREKVLASLQARAVGEDRFRKLGVSEGYLYGPLTGPHATPDKIYRQLLLMKSRIARYAGSHSGNDVVMVYYQGSEEIQSDGHFFLTSLKGPNSAIPCDELREQLDEILGVELLMLDVAGARRVNKALDRVASWPQDPHVGVFRYAWRGDFPRPSDAGALTNLGAAVTLRDLQSLARGANQFRDYLFLDSYVPQHLKGFMINPP
jgi:WD40 repeat protein